MIHMLVSTLQEDVTTTTPQLGAGLVIDAVEKKFRKRPVLRGVSLKVDTGEVVGLLGPNGAGKTTTFYTMIGLIEPDAGRI